MCKSQLEYISRIFARPKPDCSLRLILNLKNLNQFVNYHHFKMDALASVINLMGKDCSMASIGLKDAYYTISVDKHYQNVILLDKKKRLWCQDFEKKK